MGKGKMLLLFDFKTETRKEKFQLESIKKKTSMQKLIEEALIAYYPKIFKQENK
jgi:hypothetical protein